MRHFIVSAFIACPFPRLPRPRPTRQGEPVIGSIAPAVTRRHDGPDAEPRRAQDADARACRNRASSFSMPSSSAALTFPERRAVAEYSPVRRKVVSRAARRHSEDRLCAAAVPGVARSARRPAWNGFGGDARDTRFAPGRGSGLSDRRPRLSEVGVRISRRVGIGGRK